VGFSFAIKFLNFKALWSGCDRNVGFVWGIQENRIVIVGNREE
jgi:hypothetical protein